MRTLAVASLLACALPLGSMADKPKVGRTVVQAMETSLDNRMMSLWPQDPVQVVGLTQGVYIAGYGVVFLSEVNLAPGGSISPFHPTITKEETSRIHEKKLVRLPQLRQAMQQMLMNSASSMDTVPATEQIALGVTFFYWNWEDKTGLPTQIVMHGVKRVLVNVKSGLTDKATLASAVTVEEY